MEKSEIRHMLLRELVAEYGAAPSEEENLILYMHRNKREIVELLYFFQSLEQKLGIQTSKIIEGRSYVNLTVEGLSNSIIEEYRNI